MPCLKPSPVAASPDSYPGNMAQLHFQTPSSSLGHHVKAFPSLLQFSQIIRVKQYTADGYLKDMWEPRV